MKNLTFNYNNFVIFSGISFLYAHKSVLNLICTLDARKPTIQGAGQRRHSNQCAKEKASLLLIKKEFRIIESSLQLPTSFDVLDTLNFEPDERTGSEKSECTTRTALHKASGDNKEASVKRT